MKKILLLLLIISATLALHACQNKTFPTSVELQDVHTNIDNYYQIFIRSFADSNHDGIGDLKGIENNLDYLETLGVTALWLSPFHPSNTYHGYAVTDYYDVHEDFGTLEDLQSLIDAAKSRNMDIMMDLVINHSSDQHPWYIDARSNMDSPYRDYYFWDAPNVAYQSFVGGLVDFDPTSEAFKAEVKSMLQFYGDMGILKFRLDAAKHFFDKPGLTAIDTNAGLYILEFKAFLQSEFGDETHIVSEVFEYNYIRYPNYVLGTGSVFNFYGAMHLEQKVGFQSSRFNFVSSLRQFYEAMNDVQPNYIDHLFIGNHDIDRPATRIANIDARKQTVKAMYTLPGNIYLYYGDELDLLGRRQEGVNVPGYGTAYDEFRRTAFLWGDAQETSWFPDVQNISTPNANEAMDDEASMYHVYQTFMQLRLNYPALMYGNFTPYENNDYNIQGFYRTYQNGDQKQTILVMINISQQASEIILPSILETIYEDNTSMLGLDAYGVGIYLIEEDH